MLSQGPAGSEDSPSSIPPQGPFILGNVQPEVFLAVIEFLYTNSVTLNSHIALEVLTSSVEYGLQDLCKLCIKFIKDTLNVEQVCEALQAAVTYGQTDLQQHCLAFIEGCTAAVVRTQGFHELSDVVLARVLRSDRLAVDELDLVQAVREWAHVSSVSAMHGHSGVVMDGGPHQAEAPRGAQDITKPIPYILLSRRLSWSAQCLRWLLCLCRSCACPCWHPVSWQRWRAKTSGICSSRQRASLQPGGPMP
ncbi:BTB/POZ domain-containing protein 19 isoform X5 [Lathamus discolor]